MLTDENLLTLALLAREIYQDNEPPHDLYIEAPSEAEMKIIHSYFERLKGKTGRVALGFAGNMLMASIKLDAHKRELNTERTGRMMDFGLLAWKMQEIADGPFTPDDWATAIIEARQERASK